MSTQPNAPVGTTLSQERLQKQLSPITGREPNLWLQSLVLHAPAIGLGLAVATGVCLLMGLSLRILLNPNIHAGTVSEPAAVSAQEEQIPAPTIQETDGSGVRIVFPSAKSFLGEANAVASQSSRSRTIALFLGLGGFGLTTVSFLFLRSVWGKGTARSAATSSQAIVLHRQSGDLAPPSRIAKDPTSLVSSTIAPSATSPLIALPPAKPTVSPLPAEALPVPPVPTAPLTIHYPNENGIPIPSSPHSAIETATDQPINLVDLMDIRKRRPHP